MLANQFEVIPTGRVNQEYESECDRAYAQGLEDGRAGLGCRPMAYQFFNSAKTEYQIGWREGRQSVR